MTFVAGLVLGDFAQPDGFSPANDDISDLGARTADQAWLYNQFAANLNGLLIVAFALGLWGALGSGWLARLGVVGLAILGVIRFLEGFLRLDCRGMDEGCDNMSWRADAHRVESGIASALFFLVPPHTLSRLQPPRGHLSGAWLMPRCPLTVSGTLVGRVY